MTDETAAATRQAADPEPGSGRARGTGIAGDPAAPAARSARAEEAADQVTVRLPAESAYLSVLRTATAGLAARLDFTLDEIEDLRIAVDEACAMLLGQAIPGSSLECRFALGRDMITISVTVPCLSPRAPASDTFAWTVLAALAGSVEAHVGRDDQLTIVMRKSRRSPGSA